MKEGFPGERTSVTDRRQTTDRRATASEREFTFVKTILNLIPRELWHVLAKPWFHVKIKLF